MNPCNLLSPPRAWRLPYYRTVPAGFPSPAADYVEEELDLHQYLVRHPAATYLLRYNGAGLATDAIRKGDVLVVDRAVTPAPGALVVASVYDELRVLRWSGRRTELEGDNWAVWGAVVGVVRRL